MNIACISLSDNGASIAARIAALLPDAALYLHEGVAVHLKGERFRRVSVLTRDLFSRCGGLVYVAPCGVVVRSIAPCIVHKATDPAVVVVDSAGRYAVSLISGHEGGANDLALQVANGIGAEPVITTTSEASKLLIVGIGCRRGASAARIVDAVRDACEKITAAIDEVRLMATADVKADEPGIGEAARVLGIPLRIIPSEEIRRAAATFSRSPFVECTVGLPAVAEPAALLAGRRTRLRLPKTTYRGITAAIAAEECIWSA